MTTKHPKKSKKSPDDQLAGDLLQQLTKPLKKRLFIALGLDVLGVALLIVQMLALANFFGGLAVLQAHEQLSTELAYESLLSVLPVLVGCLVARPVVGFWRDKVLSGAGLLMAGNARGQVLSALGRLSLARSQFGADGAIATLATDTPDELFGYARFRVQTMTAVVVPAMIAIAIAIKNLTSALVLLATAPVLVFAMIVIGIKTAKKSREQMEAMTRLSGSFLDWIRGISTLKRLMATDGATKDIDESATLYRVRTMSVLKTAFLNSTVLEFISAVSIALVAVYLGFGLMGVLPWSDGQVLTTYETALFILLLVPEFYAPLRRLGMEYHAKGQAVASAKLLAPIINATTPSIRHTPADDVAIGFEKVAVKAGERVRLPTVSFSLNQGDKTALMGRSGSGKTTIFQVLLGLCAYEGVVRLNSDKFGYLPQSPSLLPVSIAENLRLAKPNASDDELQKVLEQVGLWGLIGALPQKMATVLSERGGGLSGGQAQRLAIAQLVLQDADVWLLDEPTEHLDSQTKDGIHALLGTLSHNKTVLWATHDTPAPWITKTISLETTSAGGV